MNKTASVFVTIIVVLLVLWGIYYWATNSSTSTTTVTPTPVSTGNNTTNNNSGGAPDVSTKAATFASASSAVLNGSVNPNGGQTSYWYEYGTTNALGSFTSSQLIGGGSFAYNAPAVVSGLSPNTLYYYRINSSNKFGTSDGEVMSFTTTNTPAPKFVAPSVQTKDATSIYQTLATLNGAVSPNSSTTSYWFEYGTDFSLNNSTSIVSAGAGSAGMPVSQSINGLTPETIYYYRIDAQNPYGTVHGNISVFSTQPINTPVPPAGKAPTVSTTAATFILATSATLNGQVNPNGVATTYYFQYGKSTPFGLFTLDQQTAVASAGGTSSTASLSKAITGLDNDSTYYYQLIAQNSNGTSRGSIFSFTTKKK